MSISHASKELFNLSSLASKGYPEEAKLLLSALFIDFADCYVEVRLLYKGRSPIQLFYPSIAAIEWDLIRNKNSEGYNCYFGVCLRKTRKGDKLSVASVTAVFQTWTSETSRAASLKHYHSFKNCRHTCTLQSWRIQAMVTTPIGCCGRPS